MNLQEFRALDEFQRFDFLKELAGDELRAFAREVGAEQGASPMLARISASPNSNDATIKNQLKIELRKLGLTFQERQADMQFDVAEQPQEQFSWEKIKRAPFIERKPTPIDEATKDAFLQQFYQGEVVDVDTINPLSNIQAVRAQVELVCQKMVGYGFRNFNDLKDKFADLAFNIESAEQRQRDFSNAKQIKQVMESILYFVENTPEVSRRELIANYKDTRFICGDGTLQNLIDIFSEMQLGKADIAAYVAWAKRKVVIDTFLPMYEQNFFHEAGLIYRIGNERHYVDSLINAVADEFGLVVRTQDEDRFIKDASRYREFLLGELNRVFAQPEVLKNIFGLVVAKISSNLENGIDKILPVQNQVQDFLGKLGVGDKYNYFHLVNCKENGLKDDFKRVVESIVANYMHEQRVIKVSNIKHICQLLKIAGSYNSQYRQVITRENFPEDADNNKGFVNFILIQNIELDEAQFGTKSPILYFARKNRNIFADFNLPFVFMQRLLQEASAEELKDINIPADILRSSLFYVKTPEQIDVLIAKGANIQEISLNGGNATRDAALRGERAIVDKFAEQGIAPMNVFEGHEDGVDQRREEALINGIVANQEILRHIEDGVPNICRIVKCGMVNALRKALEFPEGRDALKLKDKDDNVALHYAARHTNPELFLEIVKTTEGRRAIGAYNKDNFTPVEELIIQDRVDLINEVLKTPEGTLLINGGNGNKSFVELSYEHKKYSYLKTLLKCNISLDPILKYKNKGMVQDAVDHEDFEVFGMLMERAELRNRLFQLEQDSIHKLDQQGLLKPILEKYWLEILEGIDPEDMAFFAEFVLKFGLLNQDIDEKHSHVLSRFLLSLQNFYFPMTDDLDKVISLIMSNKEVQKLVVTVDPLRPHENVFKRLVAAGATQAVEAILNDDFLRRSLYLTDAQCNTFLHNVECSEGDPSAFNDYYLESSEQQDSFFDCLRSIADNPHLKAALPSLLSTRNGIGFTPLQSALEDMQELFLILLDWSVRHENVHSLHIPDNKGCTPFYNALLKLYEMHIISQFVDADASLVDSIFDHVDNERVNVISRILDQAGNEVAFGNVFELVKDNPILMRKFIDSVGYESGCSSLEYARRYDMPTIVDAILTFAQGTSLGFSLPPASVEAQASASTAWIPDVDAEADVEIADPVLNEMNSDELEKARSKRSRH